MRRPISVSLMAGLRAASADGATIITHDANKAFFERTLAAPAYADLTEGVGR
jgi:hypothetical protein